MDNTAEYFSNTSLSIIWLYECFYMRCMPCFYVWERLTKTCPCWLPWRLSTSLALSLHLSPHASLQEWVGAPWQESRHQEVPRRAQEHIWVRARKVFSAEAGETGMMLFIHACFLSAVAGGDLCMSFDAARAGFCLFHLQGQHTHSCVSC